MVELQNISKSIGSTKIINDISFTLKKGEITGLLGPNGAGKTTTMRLITSYYFPSNGRILIDNIDTQIDTAKTQKMIGYLPENNPLYTEMIVYDFLTLSGNLNGVNGQKLHKAIMQTAKKVSITDKLLKPINELSKGYKQRVGIASTLLHDPKVIILDEPTEGLDPAQRNEIRHLIRELSKNKVILLSTHVLQEVKALCSNVIVINKGKIIASGDPQKISVKKAINVKLKGKDIAQKIKTSFNGSDKVEIETLQTDTLDIYIQSEKESIELINKLAKDHNWTILELKAEDSLEELFREMQYEKN